MTEHTIIWYEAFDGKMFKDDLDCMEHELNELYKKSGVRMYADGKKIETLEIDRGDGLWNDSYQDADYVEIDRKKEKENNEFLELVHHYCGWCLLEEAIEGTGTIYKLNVTDIQQIK